MLMKMTSTRNWGSSTPDMVMVELKGLHTVKANGKVYHYARRSGPAIKGKPGTPAFQDTYNEAIASRHAPDGSKFSGSIVRYEASADYKKLADSTRRNWGPWLDRIADHFGNLSVRQFDRPEKDQAKDPRMARQVRGYRCDQGQDQATE
jgi:hypothetical protein